MFPRRRWKSKRHSPIVRTPDDLLLEAIDYVDVYYRDFIEAGEDELAILYLEVALGLIRDAHAMIESQLSR